MKLYVKYFLIFLFFLIALSIFDYENGYISDRDEILNNLWAIAMMIAWVGKDIIEEMRNPSPRKSAGK